MKRIPTFGILLLSTGCGQFQPGASHSAGDFIGSYLIDVTDPKHLWLHADQILRQTKCNDNTESACTVRLQPITDFSINPVYECGLPAADAPENKGDIDDSQWRSRQILGFYARVRKTMDVFYTRYDTTQSLQFSEIWKPVCAELKFLSEAKAAHKRLCLYSDLLERSEVIDAYKAIAIEDTSKIERILSQSNLLPKNLSGITVVITFLPASREDDKGFGVMAGIYRRVLESHGATVVLETHIVNQYE